MLWYLGPLFSKYVRCLFKSIVLVDICVRFRVLYYLNLLTLVSFEIHYIESGFLNLWKYYRFSTPEKIWNLTSFSFQNLDYPEWKT